MHCRKVTIHVIYIIFNWIIQRNTFGIKIPSLQIDLNWSKYTAEGVYRLLRVGVNQHHFFGQIQIKNRV